ncbi:hypothetical protein V8E55_001696 [Tylopilus felleus]
MMLSKRAQPSPSHSHISYPLNSELAPCHSSPELLVSPPITPPRSHKHSFSKPMTWMNRTSSSNSSQSTNAPHAAPKPVRISEPKIRSSLEQLNFHRSGPLGSGATIVRTPQEALFGSTATVVPTSEEDGMKQDIVSHDTEKNDNRILPPVPSSPPLPPLPSIPDTEGGKLPGSPPSVCLLDQAPPPRSCGSPSPPGRFSSPRPTLLAHSRAASLSTHTLPVDTSLTPPQPPFEAILLSSIPDGPIDPSRLIVALETCTTTYRTSLRSLASRPSHLSRYITSLLSPTSETASMYSNASDASSAQHNNGFDSSFRDSSGCLPPSTSIRIFLDRPSAPYDHVLAYLRSAPSMPEHPETLPRAVQLGSITSPSRLEPLLELRDEASYLGLVELDKLCCHEIQRFQRAPVPTSRAQTGSIHSVHTVVERCQSRQEARPSESGAPKGNSRGIINSMLTTRESSSGSPFENKNKDVNHASLRERGRQAKNTKYEVPVGSPPPGWI